MRGRALAPLILLATACSLTNRTGVAEGTIPRVASTSVPAAASPQSPPGSVPALSWQSCGSSRQCATISVPLDYSHPDGRHIGIALERHPATGARLGSLVLNPGGPGVSGIDSMDLFLSTLSNTLVSRYDLVTFDPRGVGRSAAVRCLDTAGLDRFLSADPAPRDAAGLQSLVAEDRVFAAGCQAQSGDLLPFVGTVNAARDMEMIRLGLGEPKLTYLGFSYGSLLGALYAAQFPTHVRAMVLDGGIDPARNAVTTSQEQATGFDRELNAFFGYCAASTTCAWHPGNDQRAAFDNLLASIRAHPLVVGNRTVGPGQAYLGVVTPLYNKDNWPDLGLALQRAFQGDGSVLLQLFDFYTQRRTDGTYPNTVEANAAIDCADQQWPADLSQYPSLATAAARTAPEFGPANIYSGMLCALWPYRAANKAAPAVAPGAPPILVIGTTGDPATPYAWSQALAGELTSGVLLTRQGEGHTGYQSSACVRGYADAYLTSLAVPAVGTTCSP